MSPKSVAPVTGNAAAAKAGQAGYVTTKFEVGGSYRVTPNILRTDDNQPRKSFDPEDLDALVKSVIKYGVLQAILTRIDDDGNLVIVAGERRTRAAKEAGLETVPVMVTSGEADELAIVENAVRADLTAVEEAEALNRLKVAKKFKGKDIALITGKSEQTVSDILKLIRLPESVRDKARGNKHLTRAELMEIAGKGKSDKAMIAEFDALITAKNASGDDSKATKSDADKLKDKVKSLISTANSLVKVLGEIDIAALDEETQEKVTDAINKVAKAITNKRPEKRLAA